MDLPSIKGIRRDSLMNPRRTERIGDVSFKIASTGGAGDECASSRRHAPDRGLDCEDAEFIEVEEGDEPEPETAAPKGQRHVHFVA